MRSVLALFCVLIAAAHAVPVPWTNCGKPDSDLVQIKALNASVWPPVHGAPLTLELQAAVLKTIPDGTYHGVVKIGTITVLDKKGQLSDVGAIKQYLPLVAGRVAQNVTISVPKQVPVGLPITVHVDVVSTSGERALCADLTLSFSQT